MKRQWQERMRAAGKDEYRPGPNIVMGANAQVALEKFARCEHSGLLAAATGAYPSSATLRL